MPKAARDFRSHSFDVNRVDIAGKDIGGRVYWKLYAIENLIRVIVHSVLTVQLGKNWFQQVADNDLRKDVARLMTDYASRPWYGTPGKHEIYYVYLSDLTKILTTNSAQFKPHIANIDQWTARLEQVRLPRNIVGHMNWLTDTDRKRIDVCYADIQQLVAMLAKDPLLKLMIP